MQLGSHAAASNQLKASVSLLLEGLLLVGLLCVSSAAWLPTAAEPWRDRLALR
jgi:hypothetical protein